MNLGCFYVFENQAVSIKEMLGDVAGRQMVRIRHITRTKNEAEEDVFADCLQELTPNLAKTIIKKYNKKIGECNVRIHAFEECLRYMD